MVVDAARQGPLLRYRLALGTDTIALDTRPLHRHAVGIDVDVHVDDAGDHDLLSGDGRTAFARAVRGTVAERAGGFDAARSILPSELRSIEADTLDDMRHLAYGYQAARAAT